MALRTITAYAVIHDIVESEHPSAGRRDPAPVS